MESDLIYPDYDLLISFSLLSFSLPSILFCHLALSILDVFHGTDCGHPVVVILLFQHYSLGSRVLVYLVWVLFVDPFGSGKKRIVWNGLVSLVSS